MTEDRGQKTEDRRQRTEDRRQMTEDRWQRAEDRWQMTEGRGYSIDCIFGGYQDFPVVIKMNSGYKPNIPILQHSIIP